MDLKELNKRFSIRDGATKLRFCSGAGGIAQVEIENKAAAAMISLQGAHLLSWIPAQQQEVIWLSEQASFVEGKSVRGGIPICWPWFGAHASEKNFPAHGFARTSLWQVIDTKILSAAATQITFQLQTNQLVKSIQKMWSWPTQVEYRLTIAKTLMLELTTTNLSDEKISIGQATHTYFTVDDVTQTTVTGLDDKTYLDKPDGFKRKIQSGPIRFDSEVDRIYLNTTENVTIDDQKRKIHISKQGSQSTIVWNPGHEVALKMGDLGCDGYLTMLCVESANAAEDIVQLLPGEAHRLQVCYKIETLYYLGSSKGYGLFFKK